MSKNNIVRVKDKATFRKWCHQMHFSSKHVAAVLDVSRSNVYKSIDTRGNAKLTGPITLLCNMITDLPPKARMAYIQNRLKEMGEDEHWPAAEPLSEDREETA